MSMKKHPNWTMSQESARRLSALAGKATELGIDADAVRAAGLPAWRALAALKSAGDAVEGAGRDRLLTRAEDALRALDSKRFRDLSRQLQAQLLALRGRRGDEDVAHVTEGELVIPKSLQTAEVLTALQAAASARKVPFDRLRVGSKANAVNPATGLFEFADPLAKPMEEITVTASRANFTPRPGDEELLARMIFSEGADHYAKYSEVFPALGWSAFNRVDERGFNGGRQDLQDTLTEPDAFQAVGHKNPDGRPSQWDLSGQPDKLTGPNKTAFEAAQSAARDILSGAIADPTGGAQFFHSAPKTPPWFQRNLDAGKIEPTGGPIGQFHFYKTKR